MWSDTVRVGLTRIFYPCLMVFGTIGNVLCLKILLRKRFRRQSTCQYLCILAVIDILFIYMRSARYLYRYVYHVDLRNTSLWMCRSFIFFSSTLSHLASWILVIVSFDRYLIVKNLFPCRYAGWRVIKSTFILIVIVCLVNLHYFYIVGTGITMKLYGSSFSKQKNSSNETYSLITTFVCIAPPRFKKLFATYIPIFDLLSVAIIPCILMIFTNIGIIRTTKHTSALSTSRKQKRNNRVTIMLLSVILAFMLLTCPSVIYTCINRFRASMAVSNTKAVVIDLLESLWYTKHALNFILYTLSGQDFRKEFRKLISCSKKSASNASRCQTQERGQKKQNKSIFLNICRVLRRSSSITVRSHGMRRKRQYHEGNNLSKGRYENTIQDRIFEDGESTIDGEYGSQYVTLNQLSCQINSCKRR